MVVAEFSITPIGEGSTSERRFVEAAVQELRRAGVKAQVGPFGTAFEAGTLEDCFEVVRKAHEAVVREGAERVLLELRVDDRRDKRETLAEAQQVRV